MMGYAPPKASAGLIAIMHGLGVLAVLFFLATIFGTKGKEDPAFNTLSDLSFCCIFGALIVAVVLVCRKSMADRINGGAIIALQLAFLLIIWVLRRNIQPTPPAQPAPDYPAQAPNDLNRHDPYGQSYYENGQWHPVYPDSQTP